MSSTSLTRQNEKVKKRVLYAAASIFLVLCSVVFDAVIFLQESHLCVALLLKGKDVNRRNS